MRHIPDHLKQYENDEKFIDIETKKRLAFLQEWNRTYSRGLGLVDKATPSMKRLEDEKKALNKWYKNPRTWGEIEKGFNDARGKRGATIL